MTLLSPPLILIRTGGVYGKNEGGDNNGGRLDFWRNLRPRWTPGKSSTIHVFEKIRVYVEYSHCQFQIYGLNTIRYLEELQIPTEVLLVHWPYVHDKGNLFHLPVLTLYRLNDDVPERCVLVVSCSVRSHSSKSFFHYFFLWLTFLDSSRFYLCEGVIHLTGSCSIPYRILCKVQIL